MDMSLMAVDTFEPFWARAAGVVGVLVGIAAVFLLLVAAVRRWNPLGPAGYIVLGLVLLGATTSSSVYHVAVRLQFVAAYEHDNPASKLVRPAANRQFYRYLGRSALAGALVGIAAAVPRPSLPPNS